MASDPNALKTYRHDVTGLIGVYPPALGDNDPHLVEVRPDAKPLAYTPIPREAADAARAKSKSTSGGAAPRDEKEEE